MKVNLSVDEQGAQLLVSGDLIQSVITKNFFDSDEAKALEKSKVNELLVDLGSVERVDTAGLAWLLNLLRDANKRSIEFEIKSLPNKLYELAKLSGVDSILQNEKVND